MFRIEYGYTIYRGNHVTEDVKDFQTFEEVVREVKRNDAVMLVEKDDKMVYYWEDGWFIEELSEQEKRIIE